MAGPNPSKFTSKGPLDWKRVQPPPWVAPGFVRKGHILLLTGHPGAGKSVLAGAIGLAAANGISFLGHPGGDPAHVAYLGLDAPIEDYYFFLPRVAKTLDLLTGVHAEFNDDFCFRMLHTTQPFDIRVPKELHGDFPEGNDLSAIQTAAQVEVFPKTLLFQPREDEEAIFKDPYISFPNLLILDCLRSLHGGEENSSEEMSEVMTRLRAVANKGIAIILLHHENKPIQGSTGGTYVARGSSVISAAVDSHLRLHPRKARDNKKRILGKWVKGRGADSQNEFAYVMSWDKERLSFDHSDIEIKGEPAWEKLEKAGDALEWNHLIAMVGESGTTMRGVLNKRGWKQNQKTKLWTPPKMKA